jgi:type I restriction enzyme R subunit
VEIFTDYNERYHTNYSLTTAKEFKDNLSKRFARKGQFKYLKEEDKIDLLIVVDQMLTGFDSKWINTLYLDKVIQNELVIQAFSRTNRIADSDKPFGVIKYYRKPHTMKQNIDKAIKLYA